MTARSSRRVVIINNIKSDKIEQAIFILKGSANQKPDRFIVREAQEIIDNYIKRVDSGTEDKALPPIDLAAAPKKRRRKIGGGLVTLIVSAFLLSLIFVVKSIIG